MRVLHRESSRRERLLKYSPGSDKLGCLKGSSLHENERGQMRIRPKHGIAASRAMAMVLALIAGACENEPTPGALPGGPIPKAVLPPEINEPGQPGAAGANSAEAAVTAAPSARPPWTGPFLGITRTSAGIYAEPTFKRDQKIGYAQEGAKVPVLAERVKREGCSGGWFQLVDGGYICSEHGTTDLEDPRIKFGPSQPKLEDILPYRYARNTRNGTPLYKSVPSVEQMELYEPPAAATPAASAAPTAAVAPPIDEATQQAREDQERRMAALRAARRAMLGEGAEPEDQMAAVEPVEPPPEPVPAEEKKWWQEDEPELHKLRIGDLAADGDDILASRMVKGFYVAVDKVFDWNKRRWFKSTKGFVTPAEPFHFAAGSEFHGVELGTTFTLPVGFVYGPKARSAYSLGEDQKTLKPSRTLERFSPVQLTGKQVEIGNKVYLETSAGDFMKQSELRVAGAGAAPEGLLPEEVWVDVNLTTQTVVAMRGTNPIYATLISTGKSSKDPEKDHSTPTGVWRIREKHITATMDGDGTAAGDLPYSIEGVPYVMYFHKAYALHGAFWHQNYGVQMSHGCVNLAPLDAKYLFFQTGPNVPEGWHGSWASGERLGAMVVIHE
jgi:hypothetical protein